VKKASIQVLQELVSENDCVLDLFSDFISEGPRLTAGGQSVCMSSEEGHHASKLVPPYHNFLIARVSIEPWDITPQEWQPDDSGG
jgi:hypothetical protein